MTQVKVYGHAAALRPVQQAMSDVIHRCAVEAFGLPPGKRFHRFLALEPGDLVTPADRSERYTVLEVAMFAGRSVEAKKRFYALLFERFQAELGIETVDLEVQLVETPRHDWAMRGLPGDELDVGYRVQV